jgi:hypothetical protein
MEIFRRFLWCLYLMLLESGWQDYYRHENFGFCDGALVSTQVCFQVYFNILSNDDVQLLFFYFCCLTGPFNIKEHVCIFVATGAGGGSAYATVCIKLSTYRGTKSLINGLLSTIGYYFHTRAFLSSLNQFCSRFSFAYEHSDYRVWSRRVS